ncbi:hypothetical protein MKZ38_009735 [Zalerion maritima]|uniref:Uncharacterized protein n=1 Tax=Zalerion maritima TaxID=339359 RepID=A0AAD5RSZ9_9PEZI|nr:hypothetical protein MKZ38_009735 [Zalerion maritima]
MHRNFGQREVPQQSNTRGGRYPEHPPSMHTSRTEGSYRRYLFARYQQVLQDINVAEARAARLNGLYEARRGEMARANQANIAYFVEHPERVTRGAKEAWDGRDKATSEAMHGLAVETELTTGRARALRGERERLEGVLGYFRGVRDEAATTTTTTTLPPDQRAEKVLGEVNVDV